MSRDAEPVRLTDEFISRCIVQYREWKERGDSWANETTLSALIEVQERRADAEALRVRAERSEAVLRTLIDADKGVDVAKRRYDCAEEDDAHYGIEPYRSAFDAADNSLYEARKSRSVALSLAEEFLKGAPAPPVLALTAEEAYERDQDAVARSQHEDWKRWIVQGGYADHAFNPCGVQGYPDEVKAKFPDNMACAHPLGPTGCHWNRCPIPESKHHPDMVPYDDLPEEKRGKYMARAAYLLGFAAGKEDALTLSSEERHALVRHLAGVDWADPLMASARSKLAVGL